MTSTSAANQRHRLFILSPVFFDAGPFSRLREEIQRCLGEHPTWNSADVTFVVVDDSAGIDDETQQLAELEHTSVITPPFNLGHQRAIVYGLRALKQQFDADDFIVTLDADGEDRPDHVADLLDAAYEPGVDQQSVVLAQRTTREESLRFRVLYSFFRVLFRVMTGERISTGNFAVQRGAFVKQTIGHPSFDLCYSTSLLALRRHRVLVPCARGHRYAGESKMNTFSLIAHGIRMMLPFAQGVAVRLLTISALSLGTAAAATAGVGILSVTTNATLVPLTAILALTLLIGTVTFVGFLTLFSGFAQASAIALQGLDSAD